MNSKKDYFMGIVTGIVVVFLLNSALTVYNIHARSEMDYARKVEALYNVLDKNYVGEYDKSELLDHMYAGLIAGLGDPYTVYMNEKELQSFFENTEGAYAGIGIIIINDREANKIVVGATFEDSPGEKAGMLPGDEIIKVNNVEVDGSDFELVPKMTKGVSGTNVSVSVYRPSEDKIYDLELTRERIVMNTVSHRMLEDSIGYLRISQFDRVTYDQFLNAYNELNELGMQGLILDLRNNPGGLMDVVVKITDMLVPEGYITYTEDKNGKREFHYSDANQIEIPLVVLVNGNSASASEVLSGAVKDYGVGTLVGTQTYGKGLVQNISMLSDGSGVKVTIAKYYTPSGVCIDGIGIAPDYIVEMSEEKSYSISSLELDEDEQLLRAIEVIMSKVE